MRCWKKKVMVDNGQSQQLTLILCLRWAKKIRNPIKVSNGLDPYQDQHCVSPDLGPNCKQKLSAEDISCHYGGEG